ncbi:hypothetical protein [Streptomyces sp. SCUT-3]|uniref:hypothetical protein n=1 Tax=Streptomyces sp. SCUT-3 TaxID=2684469 RepID=UPI002174D7E7|nr:hypothetical protein [Streptomyces sp. SCUT-3]
MPVPHALEVNATTHDHADGPRLGATLSWPGGLMPEEDVRDLADTWVRALDALPSTPPPGGRAAPPPISPWSPGPAGDRRPGGRPPRPGGRAAAVVPPEGAALPRLLRRGEQDVYTVQLLLDVAGPLDTGALREAARTLLERHANLRAGSTRRACAPRCSSCRAGSPCPGTSTLSGLDAGERDLRAERLLAEDRARRFDLQAPPLLRFTVIRLDDDRYRLVLTTTTSCWTAGRRPCWCASCSPLYAQGCGTVSPAPPCPASPPTATTWPGSPGRTRPPPGGRGGRRSTASSPPCWRPPTPAAARRSRSGSPSTCRRT